MLVGDVGDQICEEIVHKPVSLSGASHGTVSN